MEQELPSQKPLQRHETLLIQIIGKSDLDLANENLGTALEEKIYYLEINGWKRVLRVSLMDEPFPGNVICSQLFLDPWGIHDAEDPEGAWLTARVRGNRLTSGMEVTDVYVEEQLAILKEKLSSCMVKLLCGQTFSRPIITRSGQEFVAASTKITGTSCRKLARHLAELEAQQFGSFALDVEKLQGVLTAGENDIRAKLPVWIRGVQGSP